MYIIKIRVVGIRSYWIESNIDYVGQIHNNSVISEVFSKIFQITGFPKFSRNPFVTLFFECCTTYVPPPFRRDRTQNEISDTKSTHCHQRSKLCHHSSGSTIVIQAWIPQYIPSCLSWSLVHYIQNIATSEWCWCLTVVAEYNKLQLHVCAWMRRYVCCKLMYAWRHVCTPEPIHHKLHFPVADLHDLPDG